jgi:FtsP/CotA-like multicopper oxidase with cupredoxin domain
MEAAVPPMDPHFSRTMTDMGMPGMTWAGTAKGGMNMEGMNMKGMSGNQAMKNTSRMTGMQGSTPMTGQPRPHAGTETAWPRPQDVHIELGPEVANIAKMPTERLDKPGDGLNNNGRRVLTYADLVRLDKGPQNAPFYTRAHDAEVLLHLTGNMDRYIFGFNGKTYEQSKPVRFPYGQRIRVTLINDTMMEHPIHLHGMFGELANGEGRLRPLKHTINVKPGEILHYYVTADALGRWAYHCHLLYHMEAGMFTSAIVA